MNGFSKRKSESKIKIFNSPIWLILGVVILVLVSSSYLKIVLQKAAIQKEISNLIAEKEKLESNNKDLASLLDYFASESYKEREMRLKLGMQKPGEHVVIISQEGEKVTQGESAAASKDTSRFSNLKKWWNYFFSDK